VAAWLTGLGCSLPPRLFTMRVPSQIERGGGAGTAARARPACGPQATGAGRRSPWRLARRQHRHGEEGTRVREGWHGSCCVVYTETCTGAPGGIGPHRPDGGLANRRPLGVREKQ